MLINSTLQQSIAFLKPSDCFRSLPKGLLLMICCLLMFSSSKAVIKTFNVASGNWETGSNWNPSGVPAQGDSINIPAGKTCNITTAVAGGITLAYLQVNGSLGVTTASTKTPGISGDTIYGSGNISVGESDPIPAGKVWKPTVIFASGVNIQNIPAGTYDSLHVNGAKAKYFVGHIRVRGFAIYNTMSNAEKFVTDGSCIHFTGSGNTTVPSGGAATNALVYDSLIIGSSGQKTVVDGTFYIRKYLCIDTTATLLIANTTMLGDSSISAFSVTGKGTIKLTTTSATAIPSGRTWIPTIWYANTLSSQTILPGTYTTLNGTGFSRTLGSVADIYVTGLFTPGTGSYNAGTSTFRYSGTDTQTIAPIQYYNLRLENGHKIFSTSGTIKIQNSFLPGTVTAATAGSRIDFNGALQNVPAFTYGSITTSNGNTKTAIGDLVITDTLKLSLSLDMSIYRLTGSFICDPASTATFRTSNTSTSPVPAGKTWYATFRYNSSSPQYVMPGSYYDLDLFQASGRTLSPTDTIRIRNSMSPGGSSFTTTGSTVAYVGAIQTVINLYNYNNIVIAGSSTKTTVSNLIIDGVLNVSGTLDMQTYTLSGSMTAITGNGLVKMSNTGTTPYPAGRNWEPALYMSASASQRVMAGTYTDLDLSGGNRILSSTDTIGISGTLTLGAGTYTATGSTVNFNGSTQSIPVFTFNNLTVSGTGIKTAAGNITVNNLLSVRSTLNMGTGILAGVTTHAGSGWIQIQRTSGTPIPAKTWTIGIEFNAAANQQIPSGSAFNKLKITGTGTKTAADNIAVSDSLTVNAVLDVGTYLLSGSGAFKASGSGSVRTANTSASPIPTGITWQPKVQYYAGSGTQNLVAGTYSKLFVSSSNSVSAPKKMTGNITVNDSLLLEVSTILELQSNTLTLNGNIYYEDQATNKLLTTETSNIVIGGSSGGSAGTLNMSPGSVYRSLGNLTLNRAGGSVSVGTAKLGIHGALDIQSGTFNTNNNLVLVSNSGGTARLATLTPGADISGTATVQRYIPPVSRRWRFVSSPVTGATLTTLQSSMFITGTGNATNGFDPTLSAAPSFYGYDETVITGDLNTGWISAGNINSAVNVGTGYRLFVRGDRSDPGRLTGTVTSQNAVTVNWDGPLNKGNIALPVTYTSSGVLANDGWNFVGNPYASPFNWNSFYDAGTNYGNISPVVYVLDASCNCYKSFNALSDAGTLTNGVIPSGSGFWIKATGAAPYVTLTEQHKATINPISGIFKTAPGSEGQSFTIRMTADSISYDEVTISYKDEAEATRDSFDIGKMMASWVNIGAYGSDNEQLALSVRPLPTGNDTIKLKVTASASGNYTLHFTDEAIAVDGDVYLIDVYTSQMVNLRDSNQYAFAITTSVPASQGLNRFYIVVDHGASLPVKLVSFAARKLSERSVYLNWITAQELNNDRFEVERSADNIIFEKIGEVKGSGNTVAVSEYAFTDTDPAAVNYYRLKQVDRSGQFTWSPVRVVDMRKTSVGVSSLRVYPNPVAGTLTVEGNPQRMQYNIFNETGKLVLSGELNQAIQNIKMNEFKTGIYYVELTTENNITTIEKIIKE
jgi:hypothetical protein